MITFFNIILTATLYYLFGKLGLFLAIPPGFASTVWPAAGIALGLGLVFKRGVFFGVILGSTINNLIQLFHVSFEASSFNSLLSGLLIGFGAAVQMQVGRFFIRKITAEKLELDNTKIVLNIFCIIIPLSCLVNGLWGSFILYLFNIIPIENYLASAFTWYLGDTLGTLVFTPIVLMLFLKSDLWRLRRVIYGIPMMLLISLTFILFIIERDSEARSIQKEFEKRVLFIKNKLDITLKNSSDILLYLSSYLVSENDVSKEKFKLFVEQPLLKFHEIKALSWNPIVSNTERLNFEKKMEKEGFENFYIKEKKDGAFVKSNVRDEYVVVGYIEPYVKNKIAHGFDISSNKNRKKALEIALKEKSTISTSPIQLVQEGKSGLGSLVIRPVIKRDHLLGYVVSVINYFDLFKKGLKNSDLSGLEIFIYDISNEKNTLIFKTNDKDYSRKQLTEVLLKQSSLNQKVEFVYNGRKLEFVFYQTEEYLKSKQSLIAWLVIGLGLFVCLITGMFILIISGRESYLKMISKDLKESKSKLEHFNQELEEKVQDRTKELERANNIKSIFLANMSHEIRTPLNGILGAVQLLDEDSQNISRFELLEIIKNSGSLLLSIVNDILDLSKLESQNLELENLEVNISNIVTQAIHLVESSLRNNNKISNSIDSLDEFVLFGDSIRITQIITNILSNANKFTKDGSINIAVKILEIKDRTIIINFEISDTGVGISQENLKKIFTPFTQEDQSTTRKYGGTGLGLSICKELVELMNGNIDAQSELGKGTTFIFNLELKYVKRALYKKRVSEQHFKDIKTMKVLVVEDNVVNQKILQSFLERLNHTVLVARNGQEAIDFLSENYVDLVFMDYHMPVMDGISTTLYIRKYIDPGHKMKIIAFSASVTNEMREKYLSVGMDGMISKPVSKDSLQKIISEVSKSK